MQHEEGARVAPDHCTCLVPQGGDKRDLSALFRRLDDGIDFEESGVLLLHRKRPVDDSTVENVHRADGREGVFGFGEEQAVGVDHEDRWVDEREVDAGGRCRGGELTDATHVDHMLGVGKERELSRKHTVAEVKVLFLDVLFPFAPFTQSSG